MRVSCDGPLESEADCDLKARAACHGAFKVVARSDAEQVPAGPWRRGGSRSGSRPELEDDDAPRPPRRSLTFVCATKP